MHFDTFSNKKFIKLHFERINIRIFYDFCKNIALRLLFPGFLGYEFSIIKHIVKTGNIFLKIYVIFE